MSAIMKKIFLIAAALTALYSCSEDEIELYKGPAFTQINALTPVIGAVNEWYADSVASYDFLSDPAKTEDIVRVRVEISGVKSNQDRTLHFEYAGDYNPATQTDFPQSVTIPAGEFTKELEFKLFRPALEDEGRENYVRMTIKEEGEFLQGPNRVARLEFGMVPSSWPADWGWSADYFFGEASKVKWQIIYDLFGTFHLDVTISWGMISNHAEYSAPLKEFVDDYNNEAVQMERRYGPIPLTDERGNIITIG